jgi:hypothetical protein
MRGVVVGSRRCRGAMTAACAAIALGACVAAVAQAAVPPMGKAALAQMTIQPSDLEPGAAVSTSYVRDGKIAWLDRAFGAATTMNGVKLQGIITEVVGSTPIGESQHAFTERREMYGGSLGPTYFGADLAAGVGSLADATPGHIHVGKLHGIGVGQESWLAGVTFSVGTKVFAASELAVRIGSVYVSLTIVSTTSSLPQSVSVALARTVAGHISAGLTAAAASSAGR